MDRAICAPAPQQAAAEAVRLTGPATSDALHTPGCRHAPLEGVEGMSEGRGGAFSPGLGSSLPRAVASARLSVSAIAFERLCKERSACRVSNRELVICERREPGTQEARLGPVSASLTWQCIIQLLPGHSTIPVGFLPSAARAEYLKVLGCKKAVSTSSDESGKVQCVKNGRASGQLGRHVAKLLLQGGHQLGLAHPAPARNPVLPAVGRMHDMSAGAARSMLRSINGHRHSLRQGT